MTCKLLLALAMSAVVLVGCGTSKDDVKDVVGMSKDDVKEAVSDILERNLLRDVWTGASVDLVVSSVFLVKVNESVYGGHAEVMLTVKEGGFI